MKSSFYLSIKAVIIFIILLSVASAIFKYVYLEDYNAIFYITCNPDSNIACFTYEDECLLEDYDTCAYSVILVSENKLNCERDDGECLENLCQNEPKQCLYLTTESDYDRYGIYGRLLE